MSSRWSPSQTVQTGLLIVTALVVSAGLAGAQPQFPPLARGNFQQVIGPDPAAQMGQGFWGGTEGRHNGWAWGMAWFKGKLYIGTNRDYHCLEIASIARVLPLVPYPPADADVLCAPDPADLPLQAEIWSWDPATNLWTRVFQSEQDVPIPNRPGRYVARDVGFRGLYVHTNPVTGEQTMFASGVSSKWLYAGVPGGRMIYTKDGLTYNEVPQTPGTVLGGMTNSSFRGMVDYAGHLYVIAGTIMGPGVLLESDDSPELGDNHFRPVTDSSLLVYEVASYNGSLYITSSAADGFTVLRTAAVGGAAPYTFTTVIPHGAYRTSFPNRDGLSMREFNGYLYIGGDGVRSFFGAELFRIHPDNITWDIVAGLPRTVPAGDSNCPGTTACTKPPLSGLGPGFGWPLNAHMWRMEVFDGRLYVGTFDMSTTWKNMPTLAPLVRPFMGFDLWFTEDGSTFHPVNSFGFGDMFNFGARTMVATPYGLFLGTANYYYGLQVYKGTPTGFVAPAVVTPQFLQAESNNGGTVLTWSAVPNAAMYRIYRSGLQMGVPQTPPTLPTQIGTTANRHFQDLTTQRGYSYIYFIDAVDSQGRVSGKSNYVNDGLMGGPMKIARITAALKEKRAVFATSNAYNLVLAAFGQAATAARLGQTTALTQLALALRNNNLNGVALMRKKLMAAELAMFVDMLANRAGLVQAGLLSGSSL